MFPDENNNGMTIDMGGSNTSNNVQPSQENQPTVETPVQPPVENAPMQEPTVETPVQQQTQQSLNINVGDLAKLVVDLQNQTNKQNAQAQAYEQAKRQSATINVAGKAVAEFEERMKKEIAEGNYVPIKYNKAMAKEGGTRRPVPINGYSMQFCRGATTAVPECLYDEVADTLDSGSLMRNNEEAKTSILYDETLKPVTSQGRDKTMVDDTLEVVTHHLTSKKF